MAEFQTRNLKIAISAAQELAYNTMRIGSADTYLGMLTTGRDFYVPDKEKLDDTGKVGTGREFPTQQRSSYITVPSLSLAEDLNIDIGAILFRRALGGGDSVSLAIAVGSGGPATIHDHTWGVDLGPGRQLPSSSMVWAIGGADYIWGGIVIESFAISQSNSGEPTMTVGLIGSGLFKRIRYLTASGLIAVNGSNAYNGPHAGAATTEYPPTFPFPTVQRYMLGAETELKFTPTGGSVYSVTGSGQRMKGYSMTFTNNHRTDDRRPGDPRVESAQPKAGHYVNRMNHGDRTVAAEMTIMLDDTLTEFYYAYNDQTLDAFTYTAKGAYLKNTAGTGETDKQAEFETVMPKSYLRSVRGSDDSGDAILTMSIFPVDSGGTGPMTARIRNNTVAAIV